MSLFCTEQYFNWFVCFLSAYNSLIHKESGITQRDMNYYEFWNDSSTQKVIIATVTTLLEKVIKPKWNSEPDCKHVSSISFDFLLTLP